jgi:hypothetical protein
VSPVLAHGGTAGAVAEALFLAVPVVVFVALSRWSKRKARALEAEGTGDERRDPDGRGGMRRAE